MHSGYPKHAGQFRQIAALPILAGGCFDRHGFAPSRQGLATTCFVICRTGANREAEWQPFWKQREGLNRTSPRAVSTLRASPLRGSFQIAAQFIEPEKTQPNHAEGLTRAIHGARPSGASAALRRPNRQSCRFVEPEGSSTPPSPPVTKKAPFGAFSLLAVRESA